ncbi:uncharacterized protein [Anabrus simplex]|uniref:uncharacterized protein n=1 Tax=Anabrus simplex TaxID=316456 RepID=UPI0035A3045C
MMMTMDGASNKDKDTVSVDPKSVDVAKTVANKVFRGFVESITDETGVISFFIGSSLEKAKFSRDNIVVDNVKLTRQISLLTLIKVGMRVTFCVVHSKQKESINFKAVIVEVQGPIKYGNLCVEEVKSVHNKAFFGHIHTLDGSSGTIKFKLLDKIETAVFDRDCVYVSGKKLKVNHVALFVGMPVYLMVVYYSGISGCNFMAVVVRICQPVLNDSVSGEENLPLHHQIFYGTIKNVTEISGTIVFQRNNKERRALFYRNSVLVKKLKLTRNTLLSTLLDVGMPVSFMVDSYSESMCTFVATIVEVLQEERIASSYSNLYGTVTTLTALSGIVTFHLHNEEKRALFFRKSVKINNEKITQYQSLLSILKIGVPVLLNAVQYKERCCDFIATMVKVQKLDDFCPPLSEPHSHMDVVLDGIIKKLTDETGVVGFHIGNKEEAAIFFRHSVLINKERVSDDVSLSVLLRVSMPVSIKVVQCTKYDFSFEAVSVEIFQENLLSQGLPVNIHQEDTTYYGTVISLTESDGIITFFDNMEKKAVMNRDDLVINDVKVPNNISLLTLLEVGMSVSFKAVGFTSSYWDCTLTVTCLNVESFKNSFSLIRNFTGFIKTLTETGGLISFQINEENREARFSMENIHMNENRVELEVPFPSVLKVGMPVSFQMGECNVLSENTFEAVNVIVEPRFTAMAHQDSGLCHGTIVHLTDTSGIVSFQINNTEKQALFFNTSVRICDIQLKPEVSLLSVLKIGMPVSMIIEQSKEFDGLCFKANLVYVERLPAYFVGNIMADCFDDQLFHGIVHRVKETCGIISFTIDGKKENAIFFSDSVLNNKIKLAKHVSLISFLNVGMCVSLRVKGCTELSGCNFVATAVETGCPVPGKSSDIYGTIVALEATSGVITFLKNNKQQKAIFYKKSVCINKAEIKDSVSLPSVLRIGMHVTLKVQQYKDNYFNFKATCVEVNEDMTGSHNVYKISASKHIACGLGTVVEIISATTAQLHFELDGQHLGLFKLSDFYVDGRKCNDSRELSTYISNGDIYFFDATRRTGNDDGYLYSITCVWQGKKPELLTLLEPYRVLIQNCHQLPCSVEASVIALFPPQAAIIDSDLCGAVLLFVNSLICKDGVRQLTEEDWIQDYLRVGDMLTIELNNKNTFSGFPLAGFAWKKRSVGCSDITPLLQLESKQSTYDCSPLVSEILSPEVEELSITTTANSSPSFASNEKETRPTVFNTLGNKTANEVICGSTNSFGSHSGTIAIESVNRKEIVASSKIDVPHINDKLLFGTIEYLSISRGVVIFQLNNKMERALFHRQNVFINKVQIENKNSFLMMILEVGMPVTLTVMDYTCTADYSYVAKSVEIDVPDSHMSVFGLGASAIDVCDKEFSGVIHSLMKTSGIIAFKMNGKDLRAIFFKNAVRRNNRKLSKVSLLTVLEIGMHVTFKLFISRGIFKASLVHISRTSLDEAVCSMCDNGLPNKSCELLPLKTEADFKVRGMNGQILNYLSSSTGIIECCINGERFEAFFTKDMIISDDKVKKGVPVQTIFPLKEKVQFDGKLKLLMGKQRLRISSIWRYKASEKSRKKMLEFSDNLSNAGEYSGTVCEILHSDGYIAAIKNVPVLVSEKFFCKPAKFKSHFSSIACGDSVTVIIQQSCNKAVEFDWVATDAWKTEDSTNDAVLVGELLTVGKDCGVLTDGSNRISFESASVLLFGVSLESLDLTQIFKPGDKLNYSIGFNSLVTQVWYGTREFENNTQQFQEMFAFCSSRSVNKPLCVILAKRLGNQQISWDQKVLNGCLKTTSEECDLNGRECLIQDCRQQLPSKTEDKDADFNQQIIDSRWNFIPAFNQHSVVKSANLNPNQHFLSGSLTCNPNEDYLSLLDKQDASTVPYNQILDSNEMKLHPLAFPGACSTQVKSLKQQLLQFSLPLLTEGAKQILIDNLLGISGKDMYNKGHLEIVDQMFTLLELGVKDCLSGHLLKEANKYLIESYKKVKCSSNHFISLDESLQEEDVNLSLPEDSGKSEQLAKNLKKAKGIKKVVYVDRGTQTMSTGPVLFTNIFPK